MINLSSPDIQFALKLVRESAKITRLVQREMLGKSVTKNDRSPVTVGDFAVQAVAGELLQRAFPGLPLVGEESSSLLTSEGGKPVLEKVTHYAKLIFPQATSKDVVEWIDRGKAEPSKKFWTLDPIDGTKGFLRGDQYVTALALIVDGKVEFGVLGCPNMEEGVKPNSGGSGSIVFAQRGKGAWRTFYEKDEMKPARITSCADPREARVIHSFDAGHTDMEKMKKVMDKIGIRKPPILLDSQVKHAVLGCGGGEILYYLHSPSERYIKIWDQAPGSIIVEEAGGRVTDLQGKPLDFGRGNALTGNRGVLATNGPMHEIVLDALASTLAK